MKLAVQYVLMCWHAFGQWKNLDVGAMLRHLIKIQRRPIHGPVQAMNVRLPCNQSRILLISDAGMQRLPEQPFATAFPSFDGKENRPSPSSGALNKSPLVKRAIL
jgi:hypothetical protein